MSKFRLGQIALQLYTLRDQCKTLPDFVTTLKKVHEIGYRAVQVSAIGVPYKEAKKALDDAGLTVCATHEPSNDILDNPEAVCERLAIIGTKQTAYPYPSGIDFSNEESVRNLAKRLDASGAVLAKNGYTLSYHNHAIEFTSFGKTTVLDYLLTSTNPAHLKAELDTYWVQYGGGDPAEWIENLPGRVPVLHFKDYMFTKQDKPMFTEIGSGNLNWARIIAACEKSGAEWAVVEQDTTPGDPFVSIKKSFEYLKGILPA